MKKRKKIKRKQTSQQSGQFFKLRNHTKNNSTFDPKIHHMSSNGLGYQMKNDVKTDPKELSGAVLKNIFKKKTWFGNLGIFGDLDYHRILQLILSTGTTSCGTTSCGGQVGSILHLVSGTTSCGRPVGPALYLVAQHLVFSNKINTISSACKSGELVAILLAFLFYFIYTDFFTRLTGTRPMLYWNYERGWNEK